MRIPLFVVGYVRSGTTLLRAILGSHRDIEMLNEPHLLKALRTAGYEIDGKILPEARPALLKAVRPKHLETVPPEQVKRFLDHPGPMSFKEAYEYLLPKPTGVAVWGEKSPSNVLYMRELHRMYPDALLVYIVRDPRAIMLSYYRKKYKDSLPVLPQLSSVAIRFFASQAMRWAATMKHASAAVSELPKGTVMQLKYEDLVTNTEREIRSICREVGIEFDKDMLDPAKREGEKALQDRTGDTHRLLTSPVNAGRAGSGNELPDWACMIIKKYAGDQAMELGYELPEVGPAMIARLRVNLELAMVENQLRAGVQQQMGRMRV